MTTSNSTDPGIRRLADELFRERVRRAQAMSPEAKLAAAFGLFDLGCAVMRAGIAAQNPGLDEAGIRAEVSRRFRIQRRLEEKGIYRTLPDDEIPEGMRG